MFWNFFTNIIDLKKLITKFISLGALLGILGTSISAYFRNSDIRTIQNDFNKRNNSFDEELESIKQKVDNISKEIPKQKAESWTSWSKRLTVGAWKWCTRQNQ